jgi:O-antigen/teichoic acid export membrane protein
LGWLLAGSVLAQSLANAGPVAVKLLADDSERAVAGRFLAALIVARVPMFLFTAVLAPALPRLARMAAAGDRRGFDTGLRRLLGLVTALGGAGTVAALVAGPTVVRTLFGADFELPAHDLATLAVACAAYLFAMTLAQALIAVSGHGRVAMAWLAGVVSFGVVTALGSDLLTRVELGMVTGGVVAAVAMAGLLLPLLHHRVGPAPSAVDLLTSPPPGMTP